MVVALGAATFKSLVVGNVTISSNDANRGRAFGISQMTANVGGFLVSGQLQITRALVTARHDNRPFPVGKCSRQPTVGAIRGNGYVNA